MSRMSDMDGPLMTKLATVGDGIEVKLSNLPGAGEGLFATRRFKDNELITVYEGFLILRSMKDALREEVHQSHALTVRTGVNMVDGHAHPPFGSHAGSCCNDGGWADLNNVEMVFPPNLQKGVLKALRAIEAGEEIFYGYDEGYWHGHWDTNLACDFQASAEMWKSIYKPFIKKFPLNRCLKQQSMVDYRYYGTAIQPPKRKRVRVKLEPGAAAAKAKAKLAQKKAKAKPPSKAVLTQVVGKMKDWSGLPTLPEEVAADMLEVVKDMETYI
eukprot:Platyproteum_vivax@DN6667_c0_g1_i4.p1